MRRERLDAVDVLAPNVADGGHQVELGEVARRAVVPQHEPRAGSDPDVEAVEAAEAQEGRLGRGVERDVGLTRRRWISTSDRVLEPT